jgi:hypothetical protein
MHTMLLLWALAAPFAADTVTVSGQITGPDGEVLPMRRDVQGLFLGGARLSGCPGTEGAARLDGTFEAQVSADCTLVASAPGHEPYTFRVAALADGPLHIQLARAAGSHHATPPRSAQTIQLQPAATPIDAASLDDLTVQLDQLTALLRDMPAEATDAPPSGSPSPDQLASLLATLGPLLQAQGQAPSSAAPQTSRYPKPPPPLPSGPGLGAGSNANPAALLELLQGGGLGGAWPGGAALPADAPDLSQITEALERLKDAL